MWKLSWFLRDFDYDAELLAKNEIDGKALIDLWGVAKVSAVTINGASVLNFDGFARQSIGKSSRFSPMQIPADLRWPHDLQLYPDQPGGE